MASESFRPRVETVPTVLSVNVGGIRTVTVRGKETKTSIFKYPVKGAVGVTLTGLVGDERVEPRKMGARHHAVYAYPHEHYGFWERELGQRLELGQFGENLTLSGLLESEVRIGDIIELGTTKLEVQYPRIPCRKLDARMGFKFAPQFLRSRRVGYYLRVIREGQIRAGDVAVVIDRDPSSPTVDDFLRLLYFDYWDEEGLRELLNTRGLLSGWREVIDSKIARASAANGWFGLRELVVCERRDHSSTSSIGLTCARGKPLPSVSVAHLPLAMGDNAKNRVLGHRYPLLAESTADQYRIVVQRDSLQPSNGSPEHLSWALPHPLVVGDVVLAGAPQPMFGPLETSGPCLWLVISEGLGLAVTQALLRARPGHGRLPELRALHFNNGVNVRELELATRELSGRSDPYFSVIDRGPSCREHLALVETNITAARLHIVGTEAFVQRVREALPSDFSGVVTASRCSKSQTTGPGLVSPGPDRGLRLPASR